MKKINLMIFVLVVMAVVLAWDLSAITTKAESDPDISFAPMYEAGAEIVINKEVSSTRYSVNCYKAFLERFVFPPKPSYDYLGYYRLTAYCPCEKCCGVNTGITATGTKATAGRTIGVNPEDIPYGTVVYIDGKPYVAEDTGGAIGHNHIDIFFNTHEEALKFGVQYADVVILKEDKE